MTLSRNSNLFVPAGDVEWAKLLSHAPLFVKERKVGLAGYSGYTQQQRAGLRYERKALTYLEELVSSKPEKGFVIEPRRWIMFKNKSSSYNQVRFCQPDCLIVNEREKKIILVEIKLQHTPSAWRQVRLLYEPVLKVIYPSFEICAIELCRWLDPHSSFPEQYCYAEDIFETANGSFGIHLFKPGREKKRRAAKQSKRRGF